MNIEKIHPAHLRMLLDMIQSNFPGMDATIIINEVDENNMAVRVVSTNNQLKTSQVCKKAYENISNDVTGEAMPNSLTNYDLEIRIKANFENDSKARHSILNGVKVLCPFPKFVSPALRLDNGNLTTSGAKTAANIMALAIASNIHYAHQAKIWDSAEHLRYVIGVLEDKFAEVAELVIHNDINKF